jgi:hypothetical protein
MSTTKGCHFEILQTGLRDSRIRFINEDSEKSKIEDAIQTNKEFWIPGQAFTNRTTGLGMD